LPNRVVPAPAAIAHARPITFLVIAAITLLLPMVGPKFSAWRRSRKPAPEVPVARSMETPR
jgi:hypothetical protein